MATQPNPAPGAPDADHHELIRRQFGANAANYATSTVHAKGASLGRLVEVLDPQPDWRLLDVATAAGHTAFAFAPFVAEVIASDLTAEMLEVAAAGGRERGLTNVSFELADAQALPFDDGSLDAVTCRIAPHHFLDPSRFLAEAARVLRPGGRLGLVDNVVPDEAEAAQFVNDWERQRDPSHVRCLSLNQWLAGITDAGLTVDHSELVGKQMVFAAWADNMSLDAELRSQLLVELAGAPASARDYLRPELADPVVEDGARFTLTECVVTAARTT